MDDDDSSADRSELWWALQKLAYDAGVQREASDLVELLRGKFGSLQRCWEIDLNQAPGFVWRSIVANLNAHVEQLRSPTRYQRSCYIHAVTVSFNMVFDNSELIGKDLTGRRKWLAEDAPRRYMVSSRTSLRYLNNAVSQIEMQILEPGYEPIRIDPPAVTSTAEQGAASLRSDAVDLKQSTQQSSHPLAHLVDLSGKVEHALAVVSNACEARGRAVYTFDVLLALLDMPTGRARSCFDEVIPGLSDRVRRELLAMPEPGEPVHPFTRRKWREFSWANLATGYALQDEQLIVSDMHLALAILDGDSGTNRWLRRYIPQEHAQVRAVAERKRHEGPTVINSPTPG